MFYDSVVTEIGRLAIIRAGQQCSCLKEVFETFISQGTHVAN